MSYFPNDYDFNNLWGGGGTTRDKKSKNFNSDFLYKKTGFQEINSVLSRINNNAGYLILSRGNMFE